MPDDLSIVVSRTEDADLEHELSERLTEFNMAATGVSEELGFSVRIADADGSTAAGLTGWTWGMCSGINLVWVRDDLRSTGLGRRLLIAAEDVARERGSNRIFVSSFTFQAPGFYARNGYTEIARVPGLLAEHVSDVWFVKSLA